MKIGSLLMFFYHVSRQFLQIDSFVFRFFHVRLWDFWGCRHQVSGDKQALSRVFADKGCERIGRLRLVVDTVQLEAGRAGWIWETFFFWNPNP